MLNEFIKTHRVWSVAISLALVGLVGFGMYTIISRIGKEPVTIYLVPSDATLTANGKRIAGTAYLQPGSYTIEATREGFETHKSTITIEKPNTAAIDIALAPVSDDAKKWQQEHQELYFAFEGRAGDRANEKGEEFSENNPIITQLPVDLLVYNIGYRADPNDTKKIIIVIDAQQGYRAAALKKIRDLGYDPTDYKIEFTNYESPF